MYLPYITYRHGARAIVSKYYEIKASLEKGGLIVIEKQGQPVSAMGCRVLGNTCRAGVLGVHKDQFHLISQGAIAATFWFMLRWAWQNHLHTFDMGGSRARLRDGVFNFKRQWGARLEAPLTVHTDWTFVAETIPPELCRFLNAQGFLGQVDGEWRAVMFETPEVPLTREEIDRTHRMAQKAGAAGVHILRYHQTPPDASPVLQSANL